MPRPKRIAPLLFAAILVVAGGLLINRVLHPGGPTVADHRVVQRVSGPFEATANMRYRGVDFTVKIRKDVPRSYLLTFTSPDSLKDLEVQLFEDNIDIKYGKINLSVDPAQLTSSAAVRMLASVIDGVAEQNDLTFTADGGVLKLSGAVSTGQFTLKLDRESGNLLELSLPDNEFYMEFSDFTFF